MNEPKRNVFDAPSFEDQYVTATASDPSIVERFWLNLTQAQYRETPEGAAGLAIRTPGVDSAGNFNVQDSRIRQRLQEYDAMASSDTLLETAVAGVGGLAGQAMAPSSYIAAPVKWGSAVVRGVWGRIIDVGLGNALVNTALDPAVQVANIASGQQEGYSVEQTALAPVAGFVLGAGMQGVGEIGAKVFGGAKPDATTLDTAPPETAPAPKGTETQDASGEGWTPGDPVTPPEPTPENAAQPDPTQPLADPEAALPTAEAMPADRAEPGATPEAPPDPEPVTKAQAVSEEAPAPVVDRERWGNDGDEIADYARATAEAIEGDGVMPDLLAVESAGKRGATDPDLDLRVGSKDKALATRTQMRGEVAPGAGKRATPGAPIETVKARREILGDLVTAFDSTVRQGVSGKGTASALGVFNRKTGAVRARNLDDAAVVAHELGHDLHMRVIGKPLDALVTKHKSELKFLDYDPLKMRPHEGFAEWLRIWATNPAHVVRAAPRFTQEVFEMLDKSYPAISKALRSYQTDMTAYLNAPSAARGAADVAEYAKPRGLEKALKSVKTKGLSQTIGGYFNSMYRALIDGQTFLRLGARDLLRIAQDNHFKATGKKITFDLKAVDDPYKLKRMMSDIKSVGMMDLLHGVRAYGDTVASSRPLSEAVAVATGQPTLLGQWNDVRVKDFGAYLIARRGKWLYENRFATGVIDRPPTAATLGDHLATIADLEARYPTFQAGASIAHDWAKAMLKKRFDGGLLTAKQYADALLETDYVPFQRDMSNLEGEELGGAGKGGSRDLATSDVKRLRGSDRPIINPIQSLIQQAFNVNMTLRQNDVIRALDRLATRAGAGSAEIAERIPNSLLKATQVDVIAALRSAGKAEGLSELDVTDLVDAATEALGEDAFGTLFGSQAIAANGKPIVFFWDGGERHALQLADGDFGREMYQAIMGMPPMHADILTSVLSPVTSVYRLSITTNPGFLVANFIRDQMSAWVLTDGFIPVWHGGAGMVQEVGQTDLAKLYNTSGGISGGALTAETSRASMDASINALGRKGWLIQRGTSFSGLMSVAELSETGTRLAIFKNSFRSSKKQGLSDYEAMIEASYIARDYIDFGRRGSNMVAASRIIPFLNATLQGLDKNIRTMMAPAARHLRGDTLTKQETKELGLAMKAWAKVAAMTVASVALAVVNSGSEEWQDAPSTLRASAWLIRIPGAGWLAIPKPFELALPGTIGERLVEYLETNDSRILEKMRDDIFATLLPPDLMDNPVIKIAATTATGVDTFTGQDVVPDYLKGFEPWLQYSASTSFLARDIGEATGLSPLYIDHMITGFFASWGRDVSSLYDSATGRRASQGWEDMVFTRRFIKDLQRGNTASKVFWNQIGDRTGAFAAAEKTYELMATGQVDGDGVAFLAKQTPEVRAYIALKQDAFDADERSMHPLIRSKELVGIIGLMRREMSEDRQSSGVTGEAITMSPDQRRMADDVLSKISYGEARNALVVAGDPGYRSRPLMDLSGDYETLSVISPELSDEFSTRLANAKVYKFDAVAEFWPDVQARLIEDGTRARLGDLKGRVRREGYEGDGRRRRPRKQEIEVPSAPDIAAAQE